jgi:hypothetical protein
MLTNFVIAFTLVLFCISFLGSVGFRKGFFGTSYRHTIKSTWQEDFDQFLDIDTPCDARKSLTKEIFGKLNEITNDFVSAVQDQNIEKVAPSTLQYGKAVKGLKVFQNQLINDVIPDILTKTVPKLVDEGPKIINQLIEKGPSDLLEKGQKAISSAREIASDPSALQSTVDDLRKEFKNIVKSTPEGLETPDYVVVDSTPNFEIRRYSTFSVCSTSMYTPANNNLSPADTNTIPIDLVATSNSFNRLVSYLGGENAKEGGGEQRLSMTIPVILDSGSMSFVLPKSMDSLSAPIPLSESVILKDLPAETVAVREFTGLVTEGEISRQRAKLEDALLAAGISYDATTFRVFQYNPPLTLPWIRRNEIAVSVTYTNPVKGGEETAFTETNNGYSTAPEAGD